MSHHQPLVKYEPFGAEVPLSEPSWCAYLLSRCFCSFFRGISIIGSILILPSARCVYALDSHFYRIDSVTQTRDAFTSLRIGRWFGIAVLSLSLSLSPFVRNRTALFDVYDLR